MRLASGRSETGVGQQVKGREYARKRSSRGGLVSVSAWQCDGRARARDCREVVKVDGDAVRLDVGASAAAQSRITG